MNSDVSNPLLLTIDHTLSFDHLPVEQGLDIGQPMSPHPMADDDGPDPPMSFSASGAPPVDPHEAFTRLVDTLRVNKADVKISDFLGIGAYGSVMKGRWKHQEVAVKQFESHDNQNAFTTEVRQLANLRHENIVKLYGVFETEDRHVLCMMIEFADCGSLYKIMHKPGINNIRINYTLGHAISWIRQTAAAVSYLHSFRPKPIIHRDLKSPNILLTNNCLMVKLADFGTATEQRSIMSNMKGSALWMAPEVFTGRKYSTACDVYSLGICLWEVLSRKVPYGDRDLDGNGMAILWQVHLDQRPDKLADCPEQLESIMTESWVKEPGDRPTIDEVHRRLSDLLEYCPGALQPLRHRDTSIVEVPLKTDEHIIQSPACFIGGARISSQSSSGVRLSIGGLPITRPIIVETPLNSFINAKPIMSQSVDRLNQQNVIVASAVGSEFALDTSTSSMQPNSGRGHRRGGSYDTALVFNNSSSNLGVQVNRLTPPTFRRPDSLHYGKATPMDIQWSPDMEAKLNAVDEIYRPLAPLQGNAISMKVKEAAALKQDIDDMTHERRKLHEMLSIKQQYDACAKRREELIRANDYWSPYKPTGLLGCDCEKHAA